MTFLLLSARPKNLFIFLRTKNLLLFFLLFPRGFFIWNCVCGLVRDSNFQALSAKNTNTLVPRFFFSTSRSSMFITSSPFFCSSLPQYKHVRIPIFYPYFSAAFITINADGGGGTPLQIRDKVRVFLFFSQCSRRFFYFTNFRCCGILSFFFLLLWIACANVKNCSFKSVNIQHR